MTGGTTSDGCRGELLAQERAGRLGAAGQMALGAHLSSCATCRLTRAVFADFDQLDVVDVRDGARIRKLAEMARGRRRGSVARPARTPRAAAGATGGAFARSPRRPPCWSVVARPAPPSGGGGVRRRLSRASARRRPRSAPPTTDRPGRRPHGRPRSTVAAVKRLPQTRRRSGGDDSRARAPPAGAWSRWPPMRASPRRPRPGAMAPLPRRRRCCARPETRGGRRSGARGRHLSPAPARLPRLARSGALQRGARPLLLEGVPRTRRWPSSTPTSALRKAARSSPRRSTAARARWRGSEIATKKAGPGSACWPTFRAAPTRPSGGDGWPSCGEGRRPAGPARRPRVGILAGLAPAAAQARMPAGGESSDVAADARAGVEVTVIGTAADLKWVQGLLGPGAIGWGRDALDARRQIDARRDSGRRPRRSGGRRPCAAGSISPTPGAPGSTSPPSWPSDT